MQRYQRPASVLRLSSSTANTTGERVTVTGNVATTPENAMSLKGSFLEMGSRTISDRPNDLRGIQFAKLVQAIRKMSSLPKAHELHIDQTTAEKSEVLLALLAHNFDTDAPRLFPQDGEALVLTWDKQNIKRLLTIAGLDLDLLDIDKASQVRCLHQFDFTTFEDWFGSIGGEPTSSSDSFQHDVGI